MQCNFVAFEAEPLEEAGLCSGTGDEGGYEFPAFDHVVDVGDREAILLAVLANQPN